MQRDAPRERVPFVLAGRKAGGAPALTMTGSEMSMAKMRRRTGRLLCWLLVMAAVSAQGSTPTMTTISDVLYRADGTPARGTLLISWPAFTTANGAPVAAGTMDVDLGLNGEVQIALAPNAGATPAGTYYKVVLKLEDGTTSTEYWVVPATSPAQIAGIRSRLMPSNMAVQMVTREYVDSAVAGKANDSAVVHREGAEVINGSKQFTAAPSVPTPVGNEEAANKAYVDTAVAGVGTGTYVRKSGDTMTGALTLAADPTASMQASTKHYVDTATANLVPSTTLSTLPAASKAPQAGSGSGVLDLGWLGGTAGAGDQLLGKIGGTSGSALWWTLPTTGTSGCSGTGDKLLYSSSTHALTCGTDQTGGGGGISWPLLPPNDNLSDIGDGTHRLRTLYAGTSVSTPKITGISDSTMVSNLNADLLDGKHGNEFLTAVPALTASALGGVKGTGSSLLCSGSDKVTGFAGDGTMQCGSDQGGGGGLTWPLLPPNDNLSDIGDATHEVRSVYVGTSVAVAGGTAGTLTIKASPTTLDIGVPGKAMRLGTFTAGTSGAPADANFQIFSNSASSFKGSVYFDAGNDGASSLNFRIGQGGTVVSRLAIVNGGAATFANGDVTISGAYKLNTPKIAGVTDTAVVTNLNSDMVDGKHASGFALGGFSSVAYSATPSFDAGAASTFKMTLTGDVTSGTLANASAGQMLNFIVCQDAVGNHNFAWPSNVKGGMAVGLQPSKCSAQAFVYDGTQAWAVGVVNQ